MSNKIISAKNFIIQKMEHFPNGVPPTPEDVENWIEEYAKDFIIEKVDSQINYLNEKSKSEKGDLKKKYSDSLTAFVVFKMKLIQEL